MSPAEGAINWNGANIRSLGEEYFAKITFIGHRHGIKDELTAIENVRISAGLGGIEIDKATARRALARVGLAERDSVPARLLSEGQRRRVSLARLLITSSQLWLLDEILTSLDKVAIGLVRSLIEEHVSGGGIAVVATHQQLELSGSNNQRLELTT